MSFVLIFKTLNLSLCDFEKGGNKKGLVSLVVRVGL